LIGIGRNADLNGRVQELQVSLFDVADMSNPWQAGVYGIDVGDWSWSEATTDHHAVGFYPGYDVLAIPVTNGGGWEWIDRNGDGTREFYTYRPRTDLYVFQLNLDPNIDLAPIRLLGNVQHDGHIRRSVRIADVLYAVSENTVSAHPILDPSTTIAKVHFGQEPVGVPIMTTPADDPVITMATQSPQVAAPLVLSANAGGSTWSPAVISYLETNGLGGDSGSGGEGTTDSPALGWSNVYEIKLTFSEDVNVGVNDLTVTGNTVEQYPINGFAYDADSRTAVWQLGQSLQADHVTVTLLDSVTDMSGSRLDGDRNGTPGGHFKFSFSSLPGDVNSDGVVNASDVYETMAGAFNFVGSEGFNLAADIDGDGRVTFRDAIAVRNRMGTSLVPSGAPAALVVPSPNEDGDAGTRRSRRDARQHPEQDAPVDETDTTSRQRTRRVQRDRSLTPSAVDQALEDTSAVQESSSNSRPSNTSRAAARRAGR
jgi:hypothetical protein